MYLSFIDPDSSPREEQKLENLHPAKENLARAYVQQVST
jgi:hypothetical protein